MDSNISDAARLIYEALGAPPGTTELTTESGRPVRVEREPEPGIQLRLAWPRTDEDTAGWLVFLVEAVEQRPNSYPSGVPFVPGVVAIVAIFGETVSVTWRPSEGVACPMPEQEPDEKLAELSQQLSSVRETLKDRDPESRAEAGQRVKALLDALDSGTRAKLEDLWQRMYPGAEVTEQLERVFEAVLATSITDGWRLVERKEVEAPVRGVSARLERNADFRTFLVMALSRSVSMIQSPRRPEAAT